MQADSRSGHRSRCPPNRAGRGQRPVACRLDCEVALRSDGERPRARNRNALELDP
jgi:hypothetical protein